MYSGFASATKELLLARRLLPAVIFLVLGACSSTPEAPVDEETEKTVAEPAPQAEPAPGKLRPVLVRPGAPKTTISIAAVGDLMIGTDYPKNHLPDDDGVGFLKAVTPWLSSADITFGNLEGVLLDGGEPAKACKNLDACYLFRSPARYVQHYVNAGFDVMSVANNHARDFGEEGRTATMQTLANAGILHSGREGDFASFKSKGLLIALLAFSVTQESNLVHDYDLAARTVAFHAATHDIVIVSFHAGAEGKDVERLPFAEEWYFGEPRGDVVKFSRLMVDAGADLVLGHGPHVVRAMENYKDRLIAYSLGNFATHYGISVEGNRGIAPVLVTTLDRDGRFVEGQIHSTVQIRPGGPVPDEEQRALKLIETLSRQDFGSTGIKFEDGGRIFPTKREFVRISIQ
ncbi:MAG: CapA family protein [Gammaproteobacteria bacterium]|nr:CapA family protein [Gammaproteobacteria bacterium]MDH4316094.1 CapA family protein [Gammaproteobacteria bacterium]MDH5215656.1 CapA family protein [Gammaproteobacteria bacterium]